MAIEFDIARTGFIIRPAEPSDAKACRMLMPAMSGEAYWMVAVEKERGLIIGAAAVTRSRRAQPLVGPGALMEVIPPCRGRGIGTALCNGVLELARSQKAQAVYAAQKVQFEGPEMLAWQRLGFEVCETVEVHQLPVEALIARLAPLVEWFRSHNRIPSEARIVPLYSANAAEVLQLHLDHLGGDRELLYQRIRGQAAGAFHPRYSRVLTLGERTVGCILAHRKSRDVAIVDANILEPSVRGNWANVWLKLEATAGAQRLGITHFEYASFDHYTDTRSITAKLGGATLEKWALMYRPIRD